MKVAIANPIYDVVFKYMMKRMKILFPFFILFCIEGNAQVLSGKVFDKATGLPVYNAYVYLNGTSYYAVTNDSGTYHMNVASTINAQLIVSHLAYEQAVIDDPFKKESQTIYLVEKIIEIDEVAVVAKTGRFTRQQRLNAFELQFLGNNKARKFCKILNMDDIYLYFNETTSTLSATSEQPVIIENDYLGYQIHCTLVDCKIKYFSNNTLRARNVESVLLSCYTFFIDKEPVNPVIKKRRAEAYESSSNYFFKSLATQTLNSSKHLIYNYGSKDLLDLEQYFEIKDNGPDVLVRIKSTVDLSKVIDNLHKYPYPVSGVITVEDRAGYATNILFLTNEFSVDMYGIVDKWDRIGLSGNMDNQRTGSMVPLDYGY